MPVYLRIKRRGVLCGTSWDWTSRCPGCFITLLSLDVSGYFLLLCQMALQFSGKVDYGKHRTSVIGWTSVVHTRNKLLSVGFLEQKQPEIIQAISLCWPSVSYCVCLFFLVGLSSPRAGSILHPHCLPLPAWIILSGCNFSSEIRGWSSVSFEVNESKGIISAGSPNNLLSLT